MGGQEKCRDMENSSDGGGGKSCEKAKAKSRGQGRNTGNA